MKQITKRLQSKFDSLKRDADGECLNTKRVDLFLFKMIFNVEKRIRELEKDN